jgi:signal transduction histidine kinase
MHVRSGARHWWPAAADAALAVAVFGATVDQGTGSEFELTGTVPASARLVLALGVALLVLFRRINPYPLLAVGALAWGVMGAPWGLMVFAYTISRRPQRPRWYGPLIGTLAVAVFARLLAVSNSSAVFDAVVTVLVVGLPVLLGLWVGTRGALVASLRQETERLAREQHLQAEQAAARERARIAREMHDVVAHRVGLIALHAGALEVSLTDPDAAGRAALIHRTSRDALRELRQVLGVLRERTDEAPLDPQPTLADLDRLVRQSRETGLDASVKVAGERRALPVTVERTAYRVIQEGLTNVHKHAAGATTEVILSYEPSRLVVTVRNARPEAGPRPELVAEGAGHGLLGLRERVAILGGDFRAEPRVDGGFEVLADLPVEVPA